MKTVWTKGLTGQEKEEMTNSFVSSAHARSRLSFIIEEKIEAKRKANVSEERYESPGWAYQQADAVGYERAMREILSIISA
jgi:hypothetical protein